MAKLVDLLAKYLVEWPYGANDAMQNPKKASHEYIRVYFYGSCGEDFDFDLNELAEDASHACVTKSQYLAARDRLHADTMKEMIKVGGTFEVQEFDADQALWDKVASLRYGKHMDDYYESGYSMDESRSLGAQLAFDDADAFMAERAKRLKGGA